MSVYIKGMKMPTNCCACPCSYDNQCAVTHEYPTFEEWYESKPDWCPLIPVPDHGRLIDANAFSEKILEIVERQKYDDFYAQSFSVGAILREVVNELKGVGLAGFSNAPTIIPADKEADNG